MKHKDYYNDDYILDIAQKYSGCDAREEVMDELIKWTKDNNVHVRRLASEGVRIRLPWSSKLLVALSEFKNKERFN